MEFRGGVLIFGFDTNDGSDKNRLISINPDGTLNWSFRYNVLMHSSVDVFTSINYDPLGRACSLTASCDQETYGLSIDIKTDGLLWD